MDNKLLISNTPHVRAKTTVRGIMIDVCIALCPSIVAAVVFFGYRAIVLVALSLFACVGSEIVFRLIKKEKFKDILRRLDFTSVVTGLLLALNLGTHILDSAIGYIMPILGGIFAVIVVKMLFGGTGKNFVNPAIVGRIFLIMSFPVAMTSGWAVTNIAAINPSTVEAGETVLSGVLSSPAQIGLTDLDLFLGTGVSGSMGETCKLAILIGAVYLCVRRVIDWKYPLIMLCTEGLVASLLGGGFGLFLPSVLSGGLMFAAVFMATDYVTTPNTTLGNIVYFFALGALTALLRYKNGSEVVSYCVLLMNFTVPLIDRYIRPRPFGYEKPRKKSDDKGAKA